jgi:hypothetical protein
MSLYQKLRTDYVEAIIHTYIRPADPQLYSFFRICTHAHIDTISVPARRFHDQVHAGSVTYVYYERVLRRLHQGEQPQKALADCSWLSSS